MAAPAHGLAGARTVWTQLRANLAFMTPGPNDLVSIHVYPEPKGKRFGVEGVSASRDPLAEAQGITGGW